jgi:ribosome assembly protein YihI (activator of Der GTPase)
MEAVRQSWSDDRLDHLNDRVDAGFARVDERFAQVDARFDRVEGDIRDLRVEMSQGFKYLGERFDRLQHALVLGAVGVIGSVIVALIGLVAALLI